MSVVSEGQIKGLTGQVVVLGRQLPKGLVIVLGFLQGNARLGLVDTSLPHPDKAEEVSPSEDLGVESRLGFPPVDQNLEVVGVVLSGPPKHRTSQICLRQGATKKPKIRIALSGWILNLICLWKYKRCIVLPFQSSQSLS